MNTSQNTSAGKKVIHHFEPKKKFKKKKDTVRHYHNEVEFQVRSNLKLSHLCFRFDLPDNILSNNSCFGHCIRTELNKKTLRTITVLCQK